MFSAFFYYCLPAAPGMKLPHSGCPRAVCVIQHRRSEPIDKFHLKEMNHKTKSGKKDRARDISHMGYNQ